MKGRPTISVCHLSASYSTFFYFGRYKLLFILENLAFYRSRAFRHCSKCRKRSTALSSYSASLHTVHQRVCITSRYTTFLKQMEGRDTCLSRSAKWTTKSSSPSSKSQNRGRSLYGLAEILLCRRWGSALVLDNPIALVSHDNKRRNRNTRRTLCLRIWYTNQFPALGMSLCSTGWC